MNHPTLASASRGGILLASLVLAVTAGLFVGADPAFAHDQLLSSTPDENDALHSAPTEVALEYSDDVLTIGAIVILVDAQEKNWIEGEPILDGPIVTAPISGELPDGAYEIRWRVVSVDGHPISGIVPFTVGDAPPMTRAPSSNSSADNPSTITDGTVSATTDGDGFRTVLVGIGGAAAAVLLFWGVTAWNQHRRTKTTSGTTSP